MSKTNLKNSYHHGNLAVSLLSEATSMMAENGIESLSLRKLADRVGVSRTAPYHYFKNKAELLCAIAEQGFKQWHDISLEIANQTNRDLEQKYKDSIQAYIHYATHNPEMYELMFGRSLWKQQLATESLKKVAYDCFQHHVQLTRGWQLQGLMPQDQDTLRLAQVTWSTLHGLAKLLIDGIFATDAHIEQMCDVAVDLFTRAAQKCTPLAPV